MQTLCTSLKSHTDGTAKLKLWSFQCAFKTCSVGDAVEGDVPCLRSGRRETSTVTRAKFGFANQRMNAYFIHN